MNELEVRRLSFLPAGQLRVIMVGESPPRRGFFYCGDSTLYRSTRPILCEQLDFPEDLDGFIARFKLSGWYLEDFSQTRGDKPHLRPKASSVVASVRRLSDLVADREPVVVVGVLLEIKLLVRAAIEQSRRPATPWRCLRFPYHRDPQATLSYQRGLRDLIDEFRLGDQRSLQ